VVPGFVTAGGAFIIGSGAGLAQAPSHIAAAAAIHAVSHAADFSWVISPLVPRLYYAVL
jgi:hypothetical protein